jgi:hypothetical protein
VNTVEKKLAAKLLHMAAERFGNHGCNDFDLVRDGGLTKEETGEVQAALFQDGVEEDMRDDTVTLDWMLMHWLADKIGKE